MLIENEYEIGEQRMNKKLLISQERRRVAKILYDNMKKGEPTEEDIDKEFLACTGWLRNFMQCNGLSLRRKTSIAQKDPDNLTDKLVSFVLQVRRLSLQIPGSRYYRNGRNICS